MHCFIFIYQEMTALVLQWGDTNIINTFIPKSCPVWPQRCFTCLVLLTSWLKYGLTGPWMSSLKGCDSLAKGTGVVGGWGGGGRRTFSATQGVSEAQWICPVDESLWSVRRCTGRFHKSSSDTDCSRRFTVSKKNQRKKEKYTQQGCLFSQWMVFF